MVNQVTKCLSGWVPSPLALDFAVCLFFPSFFLSLLFLSFFFLSFFLNVIYLFILYYHYYDIILP